MTIEGGYKVRVYLGGPMDNCSEEELSTWRKDAKTYLRGYGVTCLDPTDRIYRNEDYGSDPESVLPDLVEADKIDIEASDMLLVNYTKVSVGTSMEIVIAWMKDKHVVVVAPEGMRLSAWVFYHSHRIFHTMQEAYDHIIQFNARIGS
jgi:nucleoside 2-deoxyribosyltransferase